MDRYNHDLGGGDDTDDTEDSPLFGSFSSYSPQYRKQNSNRFLPTTTTTILSHDGLIFKDSEQSISFPTTFNDPNNTSSSGASSSGTPVVTTASTASTAVRPILARPELRKLDVSFFLYVVDFILFSTSSLLSRHFLFRKYKS